MAVKKTSGAGRPKLVFSKDQLIEIERLAGQGLTKAQIAKAVGIGLSTLMAKQKEFPELLDAIKRGQAQGLDTITNALFQRAVGYEHKEDKIFCQGGEIITAETIKHYPPDPTAIIFYLKNRAAEQWKDRVPEGTGFEDHQPIKYEITVMDGKKKKNNDE